MFFIGLVVGYIAGSPTRKDKVLEAMKPETRCECRDAQKDK